MKFFLCDKGRAGECDFFAWVSEKKSDIDEIRIRVRI